ncbi:MAG: hypothetical protein ACRYG8_02190, partial [Janthinobacterium lividum]
LVEVSTVVGDGHRRVSIPDTNPFPLIGVRADRHPDPNFPVRLIGCQRSLVLAADELAVCKHEQ